MKYRAYVMAAFMLLSIASGIAMASGTSADLLIPSAFPLSGTAKATDNGSNNITPAGDIRFIATDKELFIIVPAPARSGMRLVSLNDSERGIDFRNNTMLLPVGSGLNAGSLVVTTDNMTAGASGYYGLVTGLELKMPKISVDRNGTIFAAGTTILLQGMPSGATYHLSFADSGAAEKAIADDLKSKSLAVADMSPVVSLSCDTEAGRQAVSFVIATISANGNWPRPYNGSNLTFYRYSDAQLSRLQAGILRAGDGLAYQAVSPGTGQFAIVVAKPPSQTSDETGPALPVDLFVLVFVLVILLALLAFMIRRVAKR